MRSWTVAEANAALPRVAALVQRIREASAEVHERGEAARDRAGGNGHVPPAEFTTTEVRQAAEELAADGIVLRDPEQGLVDFPAQSRDGRPYWLCWRVGEEAVMWWHWPEDGFAGRRPVSEAP